MCPNDESILLYEFPDSARLILYRMVQMLKRDALLPFFLDELKKLNQSEIASFCRDEFFDITKSKFLAGDFPKLVHADVSTSDQNAQIFHLFSNQQLIEIALLKSQWEFHSSAESLTYRFFLKEFTAAIFAQPSGSHSGRQLLSDAFTLLWLLALPEEEQIKWGLTEKQIALLNQSFQSLIEVAKIATSHQASAALTKTLLICLPEMPFPMDGTEKLPPVAPLPSLIQGKLFKALNPTHLKARAAIQEPSSLGAIIEKHGLAELQILHDNGRITPIRDNETLIQYLDNHRSEEIDRRMLDKLCKIHDSDSLLLKTFERNKFNLIDKFFTEGKDVRVVFGYSPIQERSYYTAKSFSALSFGGIYKKPKLHVALSGGQGRLEIRMEFPQEFVDSIVTNQIVFNPHSKNIVFHDLHQMKRDFLNFISADNKLKLQETHLVARNEAHVVHGHEHVYSFLKDFYTRFSKDFELPVIAENHLSQTILTQLSVDRGSFRILHQIKENERNISFSNLGPEWNKILCGAQEGLLATDSNLALDVSLSARRSQRQNEVKFLKNSGIFLTILFTTLDWKLKQESLGKSKPLFYEDLWQKLTLLLIPRNEANRVESLNDLISTKVKKFAIDYVENLLDVLENEYESKLIESNEIIFIPGLIKEQAKVIHFWLQQMALLSKGDLFTKANAKFLSLPWLPKTIETKLSYPFSFYGFSSNVKNSQVEEELSSSEQAVHKVHSREIKSENNEDKGLFKQPLLNEKVKTPLSSFVFNYPTQSNETLLQMPLSVWARIPQTYPEIQLQIDGHPLESISADQFKVNFELSQSAEGTTGETRRIDWFDLNPKYFLNGKEISEIEAKKLTYDGVLEYQGRFYVLNTDSFPGQSALEIFWNRLQLGQQKNSKSSFAKDQDVAARKHHVLELLALRRMGIAFQGPKEWEEICEYYDRLSQPRGQLNLGQRLNTTLKPYQLSGVQWLWDLYQLRIGGILADDMGLGKTAQALSFLQYGYEKGSIKSVLIIVPVSLTFNWIAEAQKFTPDLNISIFDPKDAENTLKANIIVCTYSLLSIHHKILERISYDVVIFDEAQYLKNIGTHRFKSSENIQAKFKIALTGTPIENNLAELYSLFHLVASGLLGSRQDFKRNYVKPEELPKESLEFLKAKLKPLILRRRKQDLSLELPDKIENQIYVDFTEKQKELYRNTALSWSQKVNEAINQKGATQSKIYMLTALLRLRQVCSDPAALPSVVYKEIPPKVSILLDMLEEITEEGHSAIVFTQFMSTFMRLKDLLKKQNIKSFEMHGGTPRKDRETLLKAFSADTSEKGVVLLMTLKTGGVGLNLTKASYVFHLEPWWNPAVENQATDRVHRLGQSKNVTVYRMIMKESVEEKVEILKKRKAQLFNNLFGDDYFSLESVEETNDSNDKTGSTTITKEDFDILVQ